MSEPQVIAIVGAAGSGKSWLGERLAVRLGCLAIDDYGKPGSTRWSSLLDSLRGIDGPVVVESCAVPRAYRKFVVVTVLRRTASHVRHRRLLERGESLDGADRMVRDCQRVPTSGDIEIRRAEIDDDELTAVAEGVVGFIDGGVGSHPLDAQTDTGSPTARNAYGFSVSGGPISDGPQPLPAVRKG